MSKAQALTTNRKALAAATALLIAAAVSAAAIAGKRGWDDDKHHGGEFGHRTERMVDWLDGRIALSDDQEERIEAIIDAQRVQMREKMAARLDPIRELIAGDKLSIEQAHVLLDMRESISEENEKALDQAYAEAIAGIHAVLTPEQREEIAAMVGDISKKRRLRLGRRHHDHH